MLPNLNSLPTDKGLCPELEKAIQREFMFVYDDEWTTAKHMVAVHLVTHVKAPGDDCVEFVNIALEDTELESRLN